MKKFIRKFSEPLKYVGIIIAGDLYIWALILLVSNDNWVAVSALTTMLLAIAAFWSIRQNYQFRRREKKERLLNEIIEWAIDVAKPKYGLNLMLFSSSIISEKDQVTAQLFEWASSIDTLRVRGEYIAKIAPTFTQDLRIVVEKVRYDLEEHAKFLKDLVDDKGDSKALGKHNYTLSQSAKKVIEEAAKIKTGDIS